MKTTVECLACKITLGVPRKLNIVFICPKCKIKQAYYLGDSEYLYSEISNKSDLVLISKWHFLLN